MKTWHRRYFVLRDDLTLSYYKDGNGHLDCLQLSSQVEVRGPSELTPGIRWPQRSHEVCIAEPG